MRTRLIVYLLSVLVLAPAVAIGQEQQRVALLVGVEKYEKKGFSNLSYAEDDMTALADTLKKQGFQVQVLLGSSADNAKANRSNIMAAIEETFLPKLKGLSKSDIVLVALAGHGRHAAVKVNDIRNEDHFYCPCDAHDSDPATWISLSQLIATIEKESGCERNLILVDACRDNPSRGRGVDGKGFSLNRDAVAVLFASSYNEQAYEPEELKHGLFTYYVLEGLNGAAKNFDDEVTWNSLVDFVMGRVEKKSRELLAENKISGLQRPNSIGNLRGKPPVLAIAKIDKPAVLLFNSDTPSMVPSTIEKAPLVEFEVMGTLPSDKTSPPANKPMPTSLGIEFVKVSPGTFLMGSNDSESEGPVHRVTISKPFFVGKYEITVGQILKWLNSPGVTYDDDWISLQSKYCPIRKLGTRYVLNTNSRFGESEQQPMVEISWLGANAYCEWCTKQDPGCSYHLPTEAQWEFMARAGSTSRYPWGDTLSTHQANIEGPFDSTLNRSIGSVNKTTKVGSYRPNAWGIYDTAGNVQEWCNDLWSWDYYAKSRMIDPEGPTEGTARVMRSGAWDLTDVAARSSSRSGYQPEYTHYNYGFRIVAE